MVKQVALIGMGCITGLASIGQNLVPNGSFEEYTECPEFISSVYLTGWENLHTNSADYFNACNTTVAGVPLNQFGYQFAAEGQAYVGMATTSNSSGVYREIVGIQLMEPMLPGMPVCLSFKTAMGGFGSWPGNSTAYSSKGLGLKFFMAFPTDWEAYLYPNTAALHIDYVPVDTALWYHVSGTYIPDSAYSFVAVGNFFADSLSEETLIDSTGYGTALLAYGFVDDIRVSFDLEYCDLGASIDEVPNGYRIYPNPCTEVVWIESGALGSDFIRYQLVDLGGRQLQVGKLDSTPLKSLHLGDLCDGTYFLRLFDGTGMVQSFQLVHLSP